MITIARKFMIERCEQCGRLTLLNLVKDKSGRQMLLCDACTLTSGTDGLIDPLKNIRWLEIRNLFH
jgi:hypothetical protein